MTDTAASSRKTALRRPALGLLAAALLAGCSTMPGADFNSALSPAAGPSPAPGYDTVLSPGIGIWPNLRGANTLTADEACYGMSTRLTASQDDLSRKASFVTRILANSPTGADLVSLAMSENITLCFTHLEDDQGYLDYDAHRLYIDVSLSLPHTIAVAGHELGHLGQKKRGFGVTSDMDPRAAVFAVKVMEADAETLSTRIVYELESKGYDFGPMVGSPGFADYLPVYTAFRKAARENPGGDLAVPMRAAFDSWNKDTGLPGAYEDTTLANIFPHHFTEDAPQGSGTGAPGCISPEYGQTSLDDVLKDFDKIARRPGQVDYLAATGGLSAARKAFDRIHEPYSLSAIAKIRADIARADICTPSSSVSLSLPQGPARTL